MAVKDPAYVLPENVSRQLGRDAQRNNILAAKVVADIVKTTLGPKGMDKMLVDSSGNVIVTNDGVTILEEMEIEHPAAKMLVDIAKTQEIEVGDGTTTAAMLAGKLLERAENLLDKNVHPTVIARGYKLAAEKATSILNEIGIRIEDTSVLRQIAITAMTGKGAEGNKERLSDLVVRAADQVAQGNDINLEDIKIVKIKGSSIANSELVSGIVINKERANDDMPSKIENGRILLVDFPLEIRQSERETRISISTPEQLEQFMESEERYLLQITEKIKDTGANVVFCQKGIDDLAQHYLAKLGILACRRVEKADLIKLAKATGGKIVSSLKDISQEDLGQAEKVEEIKESEDSLIYVRGCSSPRAVSIVLRGGSSHVVDEIERAVKDGLGDIVSAVKSKRVVAGGGAVEIELSRRLRAFARTLGGREQLAVDEFANALESIPETLAENAGLDPIDILTELKSRHEAGSFNYGLNLFNDKIEDTFIAGIVEPLNVKLQAINSASEVAILILRIDDVLVSEGNSSEDKDKRLKGYEGMD